MSEKVKGMLAIFQKKGQKFLKGTKKGKIFENLGENVQNLKIFLKRASDWLCVHHTQYTASKLIYIYIYIFGQKGVI